jgi:Ni/Fe-hydrogenase 1 B-type cytochrome subunit
MQKNTIFREKVWEGSIRLTHWLMALTVASLLVTGAFLQRGLQGDDQPLVDAHITAGYLLLLLLLFRLGKLLLGKGSSHWRDFLSPVAQIRKQLLFYLTATRAPMPVYYAHNPLWGPIYLLLYAVILIQAGVGALMHVTYYGGDYVSFLAWAYEAPLPELHLTGFGIIAVFTVLHILTACLHDWKGQGSEVSAMISGYKIFVRQETAIDMEQIGKAREKP